MTPGADVTIYRYGRLASVWRALALFGLAASALGRPRPRLTAESEMGQIAAPRAWIPVRGRGPGHPARAPAESDPGDTW